MLATDGSRLIYLAKLGSNLILIAGRCAMVGDARGRAFLRIRFSAGADCASGRMALSIIGFAAVARSFPPSSARRACKADYWQ
jgi:hypothetical protein